jgi:hypothetical protein
LPAQATLAKEKAETIALEEFLAAQDAANDT